MARGKKLSPEEIYDIMAVWAVTNNYSETARKLKKPLSTVKHTVEENKDKPEFAELCRKKRSEFSKNADKVIELAFERLIRELEDEEKEIPVNHLTTVIGTMYDKKAMAEGNATERVSIEIKLPDGADEYAG